MRKSHKPTVRDSLLFVTGADLCAAPPVPVGTARWHEWLVENESFVFEGRAGHMTARRELRRGIPYWYGYRRSGGILAKTYLGRSHELALERLEQASERLAVGPGRLAELVPLADAADSAALATTPANGVAGDAVQPELPFPPMTEIIPSALPHKLIARPRLTGQISTPVTVIYAPSGFGKSTVLNEWRQRCGMPVAWVALTEEDNRPLRFWLKIVTALQTVHPSLGQGWLSQLHASSGSALSRIVVNLSNDILRLAHEPHASQGVGLVLDNYHHIQNTEIHTSLQTWLEHIPQPLKLAISSNTRPPLALGYLKAKGMVVELGARDLRFTTEEGIEFLLQHTRGRRLAYSAMQTLVQRTEGWITGLVLATGALVEQEDRLRFVETFTGASPLLREAFGETALRGLSWEVHTFLHRTSILERLTAPLCDAVVGQSGSAEMLARLLETNSFLERVADSDWYRYHGLFAEALRARLQEQFPAEIPRLHRKAADWYREHNDPTGAIRHLLADKSWEEAAALIESIALRELEQLGDDSRLSGWLHQLPDAVLLQHRTLLAVRIRLAGIALPRTEVEKFLARMETAIVAAPPPVSAGAAEETLSEIQQVRSLWGGSGWAPAESSPGQDDEAVWPMLNGILQCYRDYRGDLIQAEASASAVYETAKAKHHLYAILIAGGGCANLALSQGHLRRSEQIANEVLRQASEPSGRTPELASIALTALSNVHFMRNQLVQAHQLLVRAAEMAPNPTGTNETVTLAILRAKIQSAQGDNEAAFATMHAVRELHSRRPSGIWLDEDLIAYRELYRLRQGDVASAERFLAEGAEIETNPFCGLVQAEILIAQERNVAAEEILEHLLNKYPHGSYMLPIMRARVILAIALFNQRKVDQARQVMAQAARLAAPEFFIRPFLDYSPQITSLLSLVLHTENLNAGTRSFLKGTLVMSGHASGAQRLPPADEPMALAIAASISPREQEVLQSLSTGLSNREIAARFFISPGTVKTHLESIYRKLGVSSRTQAVAQAHALNLL